MVKYDVENTPIVDLVNNIILVAVKSRASDIHFDPLEDGLKIRMRIDGNLQDHTVLPKDSERNVITRIKLISGMNITENRLPQDGAIKGRIDNLDLDMRVSSLPTNEGEKIVVRILDYSMSLEGLNRLDFSPNNYQKVLRMTQVPNGIILVTGATGSGKSTTTYAMLQMLNKEETNIITVEDPIEMNIEGINQVQVNSEIGMTFAAALRSILRQDPNVILIGEIRDSETARIAVRASITGHVVFSTVHTNDSLSTIERLIDMDVERYLLATALEGIISQKLARRLCPHCKKLRPSTPYEKKIFKDILNLNINEMWEPGKCDHCINGFLGRIAIQEVLTINDGIRDIINKQTTDKEDLRRMVYEENDTITLLEDGLDKVVKGFTTFEEIYKLIEIEDIVSYKRKRQEELEEAEEEKKEKRQEIEQTQIPAQTTKVPESVQNEVVLTPTTNVEIQVPVQPQAEIALAPGIIQNEINPSTENANEQPQIQAQPEIVLEPVPLPNDTPPTPVNIEEAPTNVGEPVQTPIQNTEPSTEQQNLNIINQPVLENTQPETATRQEPQAVPVTTQSEIVLNPVSQNSEQVTTTTTLTETKDPKEMLADLNSIISDLKQSTEPVKLNQEPIPPQTLSVTTPPVETKVEEVPPQPLKDTKEMLADLNSIIAEVKSDEATPI